jgi:hypothetical protein
MQEVGHVELAFPFDICNEASKKSTSSNQSGSLAHSGNMNFLTNVLFLDNFNYIVTFCPHQFLPARRSVSFLQFSEAQSSVLCPIGVEGSSTHSYNHRELPKFRQSFEQRISRKIIIMDENMDFKSIICMGIKNRSPQLKIVSPKMLSQVKLQRHKNHYLNFLFH